MPPGSSFRTTIRVRGVSKEFLAGRAQCTGRVTALAGASLEIRGGEVLIVCGPSGAGKTTLLLCVAGLLHVDSGEIVRGAPRVVYRDLAQPTPELEGWQKASTILLDSCVGIAASARRRVIDLIDTALVTGSAVVLGAREPESAFLLAPPRATVSIVHLRLGKIMSQRGAIGIAHRVAESAEGGY